MPSETLIRGPTAAWPGAMPGRSRAAGLHTVDARERPHPPRGMWGHGDQHRRGRSTAKEHRRRLVAGCHHVTVRPAGVGEAAPGVIE
ncbi:hypothetical protein GT021_00870 [Streptomyces sp. SID5470]|nr:hypothetical protein [Streptomyces sp. SID5470]